MTWYNPLMLHIEYIFWDQSNWTKHDRIQQRWNYDDVTSGSWLITALGLPPHIRIYLDFLMQIEHLRYF